MTSYKIYRFNEEDLLDSSKIELMLKENSILKSKLKLREGVNQSVIGISTKILHFEFGYETQYEYPSLEGRKTPTIVYQRVNVILINNNTLAIGTGTTYCSKAYSKAFSFVVDTMFNKTTPIQLRFEDYDLKSIADHFEEIPSIVFLPRTRRKPQRVSATDRNVRETSLYDDYKDEPIGIIKASLSDIGDVKVGFSKDSFRIYNRNFKIRDDSRVLLYVIENILDIHIINQKTQQTKLELFTMNDYGGKKNNKENINS